MMERREVLVAARKAKHMNQQDLADSIGISRAFLANIERGKHYPSLTVARKIAGVLERGIEELFFEPNVRKTHSA